MDTPAHAHSTTVDSLAVRNGASGSADSPLLQGLNPPQRQAVLHENGPLLIFAGAGSGKTNALTKRIAYLVRERHVRPYNIVSVTFTNKAAAEMKDRIQRLIGDEDVRHLWAGTFHSICGRMLRERGYLIGLDRRFVIYDDGDQITLVKECLREIDADEKQYPPRAVLSRISHYKERLKSPDSVPEHAKAPFDRIVAKVYRLYQKKLGQANALDFDDLIMKAVEMLQVSDEAREHYQARFQYVHCDEFQDVNDSQYRLLTLFAGKHGNICVVGDDDQSIYSFRGANVDIILNFEKDFPTASVIKLEQNYRSTKTILEAANHVVKRNTGRAPKQLWTDNIEGERITLIEADTEVDEAVAVVRVIREALESRDRHYGDFVVLYRANHQSRAFEEQFGAHRIPYRIIGGLRFYERKEVKDVVAYLRVILNPHDSISLRRIINVPARSIGSATIERIADFAAEKDIAVWDALRRASELDLAPRTRNGIHAFVKMVEYLISLRDTQNVTDLLKNVLDMSGYLDELKKEKTPEAESRVENVEELVSVAANFEQDGGDDGDMSLAAFLEGIALVSDIDKLDSVADSVTLMTLHSAKGLEFPVVFLTGLEDSVFPHSRAYAELNGLEEERRLCYVGITRAQSELYLSYAGARQSFGQTRRNPVSCFLKEIPQSLYLAKSDRRRSTRAYAPDFPPGGKRTQGQATPTWEDMARRATRRQAENPASTNPFRQGQKVRSEKFGAGTIVSVHGDSIVDVAFPAPVGIKKLDTNFAKLEKV